MDCLNLVFAYKSVVNYVLKMCKWSKDQDDIEIPGYNSFSTDKLNFGHLGTILSAAVTFYHQI